MSSAMGKLGARFKAMPRAGKWLTGLLVFVGVYFLAIEPAVLAIQKWNGDADKIETRVTSASSTADRLKRQRPELDQVMTSLGELKFNAKDPKAALDKAWNGIMKKYAGSVTEKKRTATTPEQFKSNTALAKSVGLDKRTGYDVTIECTTPTLTKVLHDLESSPDIHAVTFVQISKLSDSSRSSEDLLSVSLKFETWSGTRSGAGESR